MSGPGGRGTARGERPASTGLAGEGRPGTEGPDPEEEDEESGGEERQRQQRRKRFLQQVDCLSVLSRCLEEGPGARRRCPKRAVSGPETHVVPPPTSIVRRKMDSGPRTLSWLGIVSGPVFCEPLGVSFGSAKRPFLTQI